MSRGLAEQTGSTRRPQLHAEERGTHTLCRRLVAPLLLLAGWEQARAEPAAPPPPATATASDQGPVAPTAGLPGLVPPGGTPIRLLLIRTVRQEAQAALALAVETELMRFLTSPANRQHLQVVMPLLPEAIAPDCGDDLRGLRCWGTRAREQQADFALIPAIHRHRADCQLEFRLVHGRTATVSREQFAPLPSCGKHSSKEEQAGPLPIPELQASRTAHELLPLLFESILRPHPKHGGSPETDSRASADRLSGMRFHPRGRFLMGTPLPEGDEDERPQRTVELGAYWLDATEVTVAAYRVCVLRGDCQPPGLPLRTIPASLCTWNQAGSEQHPVNCITWNQAWDYCHSLGKSLPSEARWERAARGVAGLRYTWGEQWPPPPTGPNLADRSAAELIMGWQQGLNSLGSPREGWPLVERYDDGHPATSPVGLRPGDRTLEGVLDLGGNVAEWCLDCYAAESYSTLPTQDPLRKGGGSACELRVVRGGSWFEEHRSYLRSANRRPAPPDNISPQVGFRCTSPDRAN